MTTIEYQVTGMSCANCEAAIRAEVAEIPGVAGVEVDAATGRLAVTCEQPVAGTQVIAAVDKAGYHAVRS